MSSFADALRALNRIKAEGIVDDYAIAGAMALLFWTFRFVSSDLNTSSPFIWRREQERGSAANVRPPFSSCPI